LPTIARQFQRFRGSIEFSETEATEERFRQDSKESFCVTLPWARQERAVA
jgi:hypothetical protein